DRQGTDTVGVKRGLGGVAGRGGARSRAWAMLIQPGSSDDLLVRRHMARRTAGPVGTMMVRSRSSSRPGRILRRTSVQGGRAKSSKLDFSGRDEPEVIPQKSRGGGPLLPGDETGRRMRHQSIPGRMSSGPQATGTRSTGPDGMALPPAGQI